MFLWTTRPTIQACRGVTHQFETGPISWSRTPLYRGSDDSPRAVPVARRDVEQERLLSRFAALILRGHEVALDELRAVDELLAKSAATRGRRARAEGLSYGTVCVLTWLATRARVLPCCVSGIESARREITSSVLPSNLLNMTGVYAAGEPQLGTCAAFAKYAARLVTMPSCVAGVSHCDVAEFIAMAVAGRYIRPRLLRPGKAVRSETQNATYPG